MITNKSTKSKASLFDLSYFNTILKIISTGQRRKYKMQETIPPLFGKLAPPTLLWPADASVSGGTFRRVGDRINGLTRDVEINPTAERNRRGPNLWCRIVTRGHEKTKVTMIWRAVNVDRQTHTFDEINAISLEIRRQQQISCRYHQPLHEPSLPFSFLDFLFFLFIYLLIYIFIYLFLTISIR